jgi:hypothetical protein
MNWPTSFALVFAGLPAFVFGVAVLAVYPVVGVPLLLGGTAVVGYICRQRRRDALAARTALDYPRAAALVAQPLPDMPTAPVPAPDAPTLPRLRAVR